MFNKVILLGNLCKNIEIKQANGGKFATSSIAVNRKFKSQDGTKKEEILFINIVLFGVLADIAKNYLQKGSKVLIEGRLKFNQWTDNAGQTKTSHSVIVESLQMLYNKQENSNQANNNDKKDDYYTSDENIPF